MPHFQNAGQTGLGYFSCPQADRIHCHSAFSLSLILGIPFGSTVGTRPPAGQGQWQRPPLCASKGICLKGSNSCHFPWGMGGTENMDQEEDTWNNQQIIPYWQRREWRDPRQRWGNFLQPDGKPDLASTPEQQPKVHLMGTKDRNMILKIKNKIKIFLATCSRGSCTIQEQP